MKCEHRVTPQRLSSGFVLFDRNCMSEINKDKPKLQTWVSASLLSGAA